LDFEYFSAGNSGRLGPREHGPAGPSVHHGPKMEVQEQFSPELHQAACSSGEIAAANWGKLGGRHPDAHRRRNLLRQLQGKPGSGEVQTPMVGVHQGDGSGQGKLKLTGGNVVWGEARCCFIGAWTSGGVRVAINW
jgi:hypothetical protein